MVKESRDRENQTNNCQQINRGEACCHQMFDVIASRLREHNTPTIMGFWVFHGDTSQKSVDLTAHKDLWCLLIAVRMDGQGHMVLIVVRMDGLPAVDLNFREIVSHIIVRMKIVVHRSEHVRKTRTGRSRISGPFLARFRSGFGSGVYLVYIRVCVPWSHHRSVP